MLSAGATHKLSTVLATCRGFEPRRFRCFPGLRPSRQALAYDDSGVESLASYIHQVVQVAQADQ